MSSNWQINWKVTGYRVLGNVSRLGVCASACLYGLYLCVNFILKKNWAATWQNQQSDCAPSEDSDQTGRMTESSLCAYWVAKDPIFLHADSEDSDQTGRMPRLIWVFAGRTLIFLVLSCRSSNTVKLTQTLAREYSNFTCFTRFIL